MHFKWHYRNLSKNDHESLETNHKWRHAFIINVKRKVAIPVYKGDTQMEHDQSSNFCRGPDDFCWGPAPVGPTLVTGPAVKYAGYWSLFFKKDSKTPQDGVGVSFKCGGINCQVWRWKNFEGYSSSVEGISHSVMTLFWLTVADPCGMLSWLPINFWDVHELRYLIVFPTLAIRKNHFTVNFVSSAVGWASSISLPARNLCDWWQATRWQNGPLAPGQAYWQYKGQLLRTTLEMRSFAVAGPVRPIWNSLPAALRTATLSPLTFTRHLKAHLFGWWTARLKTIYDAIYKSTHDHYHHHQRTIRSVKIPLHH